MVEWTPYCVSVLADAIADAAADIVAPKQHSMLWNLWEERVYRIAKRISRLEMEAYLAKPSMVPRPILSEVVIPTVQPDLEATRLTQLIALRGHRLRRYSEDMRTPNAFSSLVQCSRCKRWGKPQDMDYWTSTPCLGSTASWNPSSFEAIPPPAVSATAEPSMAESSQAANPAARSNRSQKQGMRTTSSPAVWLLGFGVSTMLNNEPRLGRRGIYDFR